MTRRRLDIGSDGKADVLVLTDPMPRHLSIVAWGANDRPAVSWKRAGTDPAEVVRSPPSQSLCQRSALAESDVREFVQETLSAWAAVLGQILSLPLTKEERAARVSGVTSQAGARVAAFVKAVEGPKLAAATQSVKAVELKLPDPPGQSTLSGELDRKAFVQGVSIALPMMEDAVLSIMRDSGEFPSTSEAVLAQFAELSAAFASWAWSMPSGVVGVAPTEATKAEAVRLVQSLLAGARHSKQDQSKLDEALRLLRELGALENTDDTEKSMNLNLSDLQRIANEDPVGFMNVVKSALDQAREKAPEQAKKFSWGDNGVTQWDTATVLSLLGGADGSALASLIAGAVGGINIDSAAPENLQVAASMRSALSKFITSELKSSPDGELAQTVRSLVAPSVSEAIVACLRAYENGGDAPASGDGGGDGGGDDSLPYGLGSFSANDEDPYQVEVPSRVLGNLGG